MPAILIDSERRSGSHCAPAQLRFASSFPEGLHDCARSPASLASFFCCLCAQPCLCPNQARRRRLSAASKWPAVDGTVTLPDFRFGTGETLPELKLHYLTLGTPHRNAAGHVDNAVLLLHGTGGNAHSLLNPLFSDVLFVPGGAARHHEVLPHPARRHRPRPKFQALRWAARALPSVRLRRHGAQPAHDARRNEDRSSAPDPRHLDGLHAELRVGRDVPRISPTRWLPFACLPVQIAGRNRMMRYMAIQAIKLDPAWMGGEYKTEPTCRACALPTTWS